MGSARTVIIDENSGNPFPTEMAMADLILTSFSPVSGEGYFHNDGLIKDTTRRLAKLVGLKYGQRTIDVGYGVNLSVAEAMRELGMQSYGLDSQDGFVQKKHRSPLFVPPYRTAEENGVKKYCGTIEDILHPDSELKDTYFDLFTFWGSWESGGNNFAIGGEMGEFRVREEHPEKEFNYPSEELYRLMQVKKDKIIDDVSRLLNPNGGLLVVSSRYAGHGAGFTTDQLPWEKKIMLRLGQTFFDKGGEEVYFMGISKDNVQQQIGENPDFADVAMALRDDAVLFGLEREVYEAKCPDTMVKAIVEKQLPLGRIDAVYGRFK